MIMMVNMMIMMVNMMIMIVTKMLMLMRTTVIEYVKICQLQSILHSVIDKQVQRHRCFDILMDPIVKNVKQSFFADRSCADHQSSKNVEQYFLVTDHQMAIESLSTGRV